MTKPKPKLEAKPIEEFSKRDWEIAYNKLNEKHDKLKDEMRKAMNNLSQAQGHLSEAVL